MSSPEAPAVSAVSGYLGHFIDGKEVSDRERTQDVFDPASGEVICKVGLAGKSTVLDAVAAAASAFPTWRETPPQKRAQVLFRYKQLLQENSKIICQLITAEHGKVIDDAQGELTRGIEVVDYACGISELLKGEYSKNAGPEIDSWSEFQPLGVVAGITPFNFPAMVPMWMFPMAIACGNTFILKPSERDPSPALLLGKLLTDAGLPDGVFNVINGDSDTVQYLIDDERIEAFSFVGSTPVAESIFRRCSAEGKRVQALGGAKNHAVILPDADLDNAVNALMGAAYGSCGERCMAISVVVCVGDDTADKTVALLQEKISDLKIGPGVDAANDMGPLISKDALQRVTQYINQGVAEGADLLEDGRGFSLVGHESGFFIGATLFDRVQPSMSIYRDEIFGPVLCVLRVESLGAAMKLINQHEFGNGACLFTRDGESARYFSNNVQVGMVGINIPLPVPIASQSFGGWKRSLFGDLYVYGPDAITFYTRRKTMTQRWPTGSFTEKARYAFPSS